MIVSKIKSPLENVAILISRKPFSAIIFILFSHWVLIILLSILHSPIEKSLLVQYLEVQLPKLSNIGSSTGHPLIILFNNKISNSLKKKMKSIFIFLLFSIFILIFISMKNLI